MSSRQQRYRNLSSNSMGRERTDSDDGYYQGMLKATDGRKGTSMATANGHWLHFNSWACVCDSAGQQWAAFQGRCVWRNSFKEVGSSTSVVWCVMLCIFTWIHKRIPDLLNVRCHNTFCYSVKWLKVLVWLGCPLSSLDTPLFQYMSSFHWFYSGLLSNLHAKNWNMFAPGDIWYLTRHSAPIYSPVKSNELTFRWNRIR